jgi:hypothetical protein
MAGNAEAWAERAAAALRVARRTHHGRLAAAALAGAQAAVGAFVRVAHILFLEVTAFFFACFAVIGGVAAWREYQRYAAHQAPAGKAVLAGVFSLVFAWFAISGFWRARGRKESS